VHPGSGIDPHDPERAELALSLAPVAVGVLFCSVYCLVRNAEYIFTSASVAFCTIQNFTVAGARGDASLDSWHILSLLAIWQHTPHKGSVGTINHGLGTQVSLPFGWLLGQDMAHV
jgi:hypothetical protein